jgi:hexokinase
MRGGVLVTLALERYLSDVHAALFLPAPVLRRIAGHFAEEAEAGMNKNSSSLQMLPTFVDRASGSEKGNYLALDFGGTHVRVAQVSLEGNGVGSVSKLLRCPLKSNDGAYDYTKNVDVEELFSFLAEQVVKIADDQPWILGHSFSFASRQRSLSQAYLTGWTKEINVLGVAGQEIGELLSTALQKKKKDNIRPVAVINDTTATFLATSYVSKNTTIGSVCGTGHNTCYWQSGKAGEPGMAYNTEAGGFDKLSFTAWDAAIDQSSGTPGRQRLEKMVAGRYIGEVVRLILREVPNTCGDLSSDEISAETMAIWLDKNCKLNEETDGMKARRAIAEIVVERAAALVAATFAGMLQMGDPARERPHVIGMNGSLFEKMPGFVNGIEKTLARVFGWSPALLKMTTVNEATLVGAAIAAAMAEKNQGGLS